MSLAMKAGRLMWGFDTVVSGIKAAKVELVVTASDISAKSLKELEFFCKAQKTPLYKIELKSEELWYALGRNTKILGVADKGFALKLSGMM